MDGQFLDHGGAGGQLKSASLAILGTSIRRDADGRYNLNDCHKSAGAAKAQQPANWMRLQHTQELIAEMKHSSEVRSGADPVKVVNGGAAPGTYVAKELVYDYAMWISPAFSLTVIRAFDAMVGDQTSASQESDEITLSRALLIASGKLDEAKQQIAVLGPKAAALDRIASADGSLCITDAAKSLQVRPKDLFGYLDRHGWTYRRTGSDHRCAYQTRIVSGDLVHKVTTVLRPDGSEKVTEQVRVTPAGLAKLAKLFPSVLELVAA